VAFQVGPGWGTGPLCQCPRHRRATLSVSGEAPRCIANQMWVGPTESRSLGIPPTQSTFACPLWMGTIDWRYQLLNPAVGYPV